MADRLPDGLKQVKSEMKGCFGGSVFCGSMKGDKIGWQLKINLGPAGFEPATSAV
jgi:hypothetical protein